ncbi:MAG: EAL domain-containing protein [Pseudomonadota bacterium]
MSVNLRPRALLASATDARWIFFISAIVTWPIMAEMELFERFYDFSRAHEDWDVDEIALLIFNLALALLVSTMAQSRRLKRLARERADEHKRAEKNARHDPLTGLMNRRAFADMLETMELRWSHGEERFLAMIDLDRFKPVNDLQGHAAGDVVLQGVADRLEAEVGDAGVVARLGGDEFAVIFDPATDAKQVERAARRLLHAMQQAFEFKGTQIFIGCSIGLAHWSTGLSCSDALSHADKALYLAKTEGRGQFAWYDSDLDRQSTARAEIEVDLRQAIHQGQIKPWFQPIFDIDSRQLIGFEVLARWIHRTRGEISPSVFIEIAEDSGQIGELGDSVLRQACISANAWNPSLTLAFNLSAIQFLDPGLVNTIQTILTDCRFDPKRLTIEITESSIIQDFDTAREKLVALKALGIAVALDDFGTGYSSLASLRQLPFDRIKIDRSFVTDICNQPQNQTIVSGIMTLARGLDLDVTAEGIESREDLEYLKTQQCSLGQGFFFETAVPAEDVLWFLETKWADSAQEDALPPKMCTSP